MELVEWLAEEGGGGAERTPAPGAELAGRLYKWKKKKKKAECQSLDTMGGCGNWCRGWWELWQGEWDGQKQRARKYDGEREIKKPPHSTFFTPSFLAFFCFLVFVFFLLFLLFFLHVNLFAFSFGSLSRSLSLFGGLFYREILRFIFHAVTRKFVDVLFFFFFCRDHRKRRKGEDEKGKCG